MKFRIISDLHVDINKKYYSKFKFDPNSYYLIAGDIAGGRHKAEEFLHYHMSIGKLTNGIFIEGNHMGYDLDWNEHDNTKEACYAYLAEQFPLTSNVSFMENNFKEIPDTDIIIVGCTLYTDYKAFGNQELGMRIGVTYLNDFRYVHTYSNLGGDRLVTPVDYLDRHEKSLQFIDEMCKSNPTSRIIVVTHHGPSKQSLSTEYATDLLSSSYVSNLEDFIISHPNIKVWCHGHCHRKFDYYIGQCRVLCNPFGYFNENGMKLTQPIGLSFTL